MGGAIFPGIKIAMEALFMKASKLPRVDIAQTEHAIGRTTVQSMQSGAVRGYVGALTGIILDMQKELEGDARVVATGGMGRMMAEHCGLIDDVDPNLDRWRACAAFMKITRARSWTARWRQTARKKSPRKGERRPAKKR